MKRTLALCLLVLAIASRVLAQGTIVYDRFDPVASYPIAAQWEIDFNHDGVDELQINFSGYDLGYQWTSIFFSLSGAAQSSSPSLQGVSSGTAIGFDTGEWADLNGSVVYWSEFNGQNNTSQTWYALPAESPYLPVQFQLDDGLHYGWVRFVTDSIFGFQDWAYETRANTPILAGAVPEPSTVALGVLGLLALVFQRHLSQMRNSGRLS